MCIFSHQDKDLFNESEESEIIEENEEEIED
jgi:hypothetical protein